MEFIRENNRIYFENADNKVVAEVTFPAIDTDTVCIDHTFVDDSLRGQGVAGRLMEEVVKHLQKNHLTARATCSYAVSWFSKHPEYAAIYKC